MFIQRFGDSCQAIFKRAGSDGFENEKLKDDQVLYIHNNTRFREKLPNRCGYYVLRIIINL